MRGEFVEALRLAQEVEQVGEDAADLHLEGLGWQGQAWALWHTGQTDAALRLGEQANAAFRAIPDYASLVLTEALCARCQLRDGHLAQALGMLQEAARLIDEHKLRGFYRPPVFNGLAEVRLPAAKQGAGDALREAGRACRRAIQEASLSREAVAMAYRLQGRFEWHNQRQRAARAAWEHSLAAAEQVGAVYELGRTHLEMGTRLHDPTHVEQAREIFARLGAKHDLRAAAAALSAWRPHATTPAQATGR
jgi:tetratricopeptide (TPR) repeat protein